MGIKLDSCSCFKNSDDIAIEVELNSSKKKKIKILTQPISNSLQKKESFKSSSIEPELSKIISNKDYESIFSEKNDLKPRIKNINSPEIIIQSIFRGYIYRKKFNEIDGIKQELIEENNKIVKSIENDFVSKLIIKGEKLFSNKDFEENWKKYYDSKEIDELILQNKNIYMNIKKDILIKTNCLLSKYKNEDCLYKGTLFLNNIQKDNHKKTYNINSLTGKGILYLRNGKKFQGNFINGELNGWCRYINTKGVCYEGLFINGVLNGKGEIIKIDEKRRKHIYKGDLKNFKKEGKGVEKTSDFNYEGEFKNDIKHGKGKIHYNNGDIYEGQFNNGEITGKGFYTWKNKHTYLGDFVGGKMHGRGLYKWTDGNQYEGEYNNNIKEGQGEFRWKDGRVYKGTFENGRPHGKGLLTVKGITFDAAFDNGRYLGDLHASINSPSNS
jgi:hypothetical protein